MDHMEKYFNINGLCYPDKHYMVNLETRLQEIRNLVERGDYFIINRARQYGKTTILRALSQYLQNDFAVISLSFQRMSTAKFKNEYVFSAAFAQAFLKVVNNTRKKIAGLDPLSVKALETALDDSMDLVDLFNYLSDICASSKKPIILIIDEVDSASNNQVFLDFLAQLRDSYLDREDTPTFQSVILAGVYDIKNLKQKIRPDEEHRYNSPWNIAAKFTVDMSFSVQDIKGMINEYNQIYHIDMDINVIAQSIYDYTSGYPFLVSYICKLLDEQISAPALLGDKEKAWTITGIKEAIKILMRDSNTLFDDMRKKVEDYSELRNMLRSILFNGKSFPYNPDSYPIDIGTMFGFVKEKEGAVVISNRIFETRLYNLFMSEDLVNSETYQAALLDRNQFILNGHLNMELIMKKFMGHFTEVYADCNAAFIEDNGRRLFLLYLKPIINGTGNYYAEARTRDLRRTDVIIDYRGQQEIVEMKIWHGEEYNRKGEEQLAGYLEDYRLDKGYLVTFSFNKRKKVGMTKTICNGKTIVEIVV